MEVRQAREDQDRSCCAGDMSNIPERKNCDVTHNPPGCSWDLDQLKEWASNINKLSSLRGEFPLASCVYLFVPLKASVGHKGRQKHKAPKDELVVTALCSCFQLKRLTEVNCGQIEVQKGKVTREGKATQSVNTA
eukprot:805986-Pelagomonas_calceolata.AAC.1